MNRKIDHFKKGFTLIELLVVIAIIALLMSILMPGLRRAKQQAVEVICLTRLKDIGHATGLYLVDNSNKLPTMQDYYCRWMHKLAPYYGIETRGEKASSLWGVYSWTVYRCPTQEKYAPANRNGGPNYGAAGLYGYNRFFGAEGGVSNPNRRWMWRKLSSIDDPGSLPLFGDMSAETIDVPRFNVNPDSLGAGGMAIGGINKVFPHPRALSLGWTKQMFMRTYLVSDTGPACNHGNLATTYLFADFHVASVNYSQWQLDLAGLKGWADYFHPKRDVTILAPNIDPPDYEGKPQ